MQGSSERALKKGSSGLVAAVERWGGSEWEDGRVAGRGQALEKAHASQNEGKRARSWVIRDQGIWRESVRGSYFTRGVRGAPCRGARRGPSGEHTRLSTDGKNDILAPPTPGVGCMMEQWLPIRVLRVGKQGVPGDVARQEAHSHVRTNTITPPTYTARYSGA